MLAFNRIQKAFNNAHEIEFGDLSKFVIISDVHRGDGSRADNFEQNKNILLAALSHYYKEGYSYIEIGDGDELWENKSFDVISESHGEILDVLSKFYSNDRMHWIYGNHDINKKDAKWVEKNLYTRYCKRQKQIVPLFPNIRVHEALILKHKFSGARIFLLHGHQADFFNDTLWPLSRFLCRYVWRPLETIGVNNPTSAATNDEKKNTVEGHLMHWAQHHDILTIAGHTHRTRFPEPSEIPYFNDGCCVRAGYITAIEIKNGKIRLVKWSVTPKDDDTLSVKRKVLEGPMSLQKYFIGSES